MRSPSLVQPAIPEVHPDPAEVVTVDDLRASIVADLEARDIKAEIRPDGSVVAWLPDGLVALAFRHGRHVPAGRTRDPAPSDQFPALDAAPATISLGPHNGWGEGACGDGCRHEHLDELDAIVRGYPGGIDPFD